MGYSVVDLTIRIYKPYKISVLILCNTAHHIEWDGADTLVFNKGSYSVDFALVNRVRLGDIVISQDYGLARSALVLNQNDMEYTAENINSLLETHYQSKKLLRAGKHPNGPAKRTREQDVKFENKLLYILGLCTSYQSQLTLHRKSDTISNKRGKTLCLIQFFKEIHIERR